MLFDMRNKYKYTKLFNSDGLGNGGNIERLLDLSKYRYIDSSGKIHTMIIYNNVFTGIVEKVWKDNENNTFVTRNGEMLVTVKDHTRRFKVKYCPNCGRRL